MKKARLLRKIIFIFIIFFIIIVPFSLAHSGRTDSNGGHYDWSTGEYHYHNDNSSYDYKNQVILDDSKYVNRLEEENKQLEQQIEFKQRIINNLNEDIEKYEKNIKNKESEQNTWHFIYITIILVLIAYIYNLKNKAKTFKGG